MAQRIAIIKGGKVVNIALYPDDFVPDGVLTVTATAEAQIGGTFAGNKFTVPVRVPELESDVIQALRALADEIDAGTTEARAKINALLGAKV